MLIIYNIIYIYIYIYYIIIFYSAYSNFHFKNCYL